jgi:RNA polymerase sigma-70 factor, ECF subfamily
LVPVANVATEEAGRVPQSATRPIESLPPIDAPVPSARSLFTQYHRYVGKVGQSVLGTAGDVDDLVQDVFVAALKDVHKLRDPGRVRGWLATVTLRMARRQRFSRAQTPVSLTEELPEIVDETLSPEQRTELSAQLEQILGLPEELRTPWLLRHWDDMTLHDIAAQCGISLSTAQRRLTLAQTRLAKFGNKTSPGN